jgi:hypothetical protein
MRHPVAWCGALKFNDCRGKFLTGDAAGLGEKQFAQFVKREMPILRRFPENLIALLEDRFR